MTQETMTTGKNYFHTLWVHVPHRDESGFYKLAPLTLGNPIYIIFYLQCVL